MWCYRCQTDRKTTKYKATQLVWSLKFKLSQIICFWCENTQPLLQKDRNQRCPEGYIQDGIVLEELSAFDIHFLPGFHQSRQRRASLKINSDLFKNHMIFCINVMLMSRQVYVVYWAWLQALTSDYTIMVSREIESHHKWLRPLLYWGGLTLHTGYTVHTDTLQEN